MYNCFCKHSVNNIHCRIFLILSEIVKSISYFSDFTENKFVSRKGLCTFPDLSRVCFNIHLIENLKGLQSGNVHTFYNRNFMSIHLLKMEVMVEWESG